MNIVECQLHYAEDVVYQGQNAVLGEVVDDYRVKIHLWHSNRVLTVAPRNLSLLGADDAN